MLLLVLLRMRPLLIPLRPVLASLRRGLTARWLLPCMLLASHVPFPLLCLMLRQLPGVHQEILEKGGP